MSGENKAHDESLTTGAGARYNFEFAHPTTLSNVSSSPFAPKSVWGDRTYADYDAVSALGLVDFSGGMGQERLTDTTMFYDSEDIDTRGGHIILGPTATLLSSPSGEGSLASMRSSWVSFSTAGHTKLARSFSTAADQTLIQRAWFPLAADHGAGTVTVKLCANDAGAPGTVLATTTIAASTLTSYGQWLQAVFSPAPAVTANVTYWFTLEQSTAIEIYWATHLIQAPSDSYHWDGAAWVQAIGRNYAIYYDDPRVRADSPPKMFVGAGGDSISRVWYAAGRTLFYVGSANTPAAVTTTAGGAVNQTASDIVQTCWYQAPTDSASWIYCALGDSTDMVRFNASIGAESWAAPTGTKAGVAGSTQAARRLCTHDNLLVYAYDRNNIDCYNGVSWGARSPAPAEAGDRTYAIRAITSWNGAVWVGKDDGLYKVTIPAGYPITGSLTCQRIVDFTSVADTINFSFMVVHHGDLYFNLNNGIMRFTAGGVLQSIAPDTALNISSDKRYHYRAAVSVLGSLWVLAESGLGGIGRLLAYVEGHWHPVSGFSDKPLRSICIEPGWYGDLPRTWLGLGLSPAYEQMPTTTQRRWLWTDADYASYGELYTSWIDGNIRTVVKDWITVEIDGYNLSDYVAISVWWRPNDTTTWSLLGTADTNGITSLAFPAGSHSNKCQLKIGLGRGGTTTDTPRVEAIVLKYMERPDDVRSMTRSYKLADRLENRNGALVTRSLAQQMDDLRTLREEKEPLTLQTWYGSTHTVHIVDYSVSEMPAEFRETGDKGQMLAIVRLQEITT